MAGERSVPTVVYHLAKFPKEEEIDGIRYIRINANKLPATPYKLIKSPAGLARLLRDGVDVAVKMSRFLKEKNLIKELIKHLSC